MSADREAPGPLDVVLCDSCPPIGAAHMNHTDTRRDEIAEWYEFKCPECGARGVLEDRHEGPTKLWGVTTPERLDMRREAAIARARRRGAE